MSINKADYIKAVNWDQFRDFNGIQSDFIVNKMFDILNIEHKDSYPAIFFPKTFISKLHRKFYNGKGKFKDLISIEYILASTFFHPLLYWKTLKDEKKKHYFLYNKKPYIPQKPELEKIPLTYEKYVKTNNYGFLFIIWLFIAVFFLKMGLNLSDEDDKSLAYILVLLWIPTLFLMISENGETKFRNKTRLYSYWKRRRFKKECLKEYEKKLNIYNNLLNTFPQAKAKYEEVREFQSNLITQKQKTIIKNLITDSINKSTDFIQVYEGAPKGASEDKFFYLLMKYIPKQIFIDGKVGKYYPDLIVKTSNGICIDIEIDEPYEYKDKKEIHYIGCGDKERDNYFLDNNWFVIRFSEYQIKYYTNRCVRIVLLLKDLIELGDCKCNSLVNLVDEISMPFWTKEEARVMAIENFRENAPRPIDW